LILSTHRNALIYQRKFFLPMPGFRTTTHQKNLLLISKENSRNSKHDLKPHVCDAAVVPWQLVEAVKFAGIVNGEGEVLEHFLR
jgi:hypothetical protein